MAPQAIVRIVFGLLFQFASAQDRPEHLRFYHRVVVAIVISDISQCISMSVLYGQRQRRGE